MLTFKLALLFYGRSCNRSKRGRTIKTSMGKSSLPFVLCNLITFVTMATACSDESTCKLMTTYNTGLMPSIGQAETRRSGIIEALKNTDDDFMCLQELWFEKDMAALLDGLKTVFPHHYSKIHAEMDILRNDDTTEGPLKDTPCTPAESNTLGLLLGPCGHTNGCFNITDAHKQGFCIITKCGHLLTTESVRESCVSCILLYAPTPLQASLQQCATPLPVHNRLNGPGLLILSKTELLAVNYTKYFPDNRMALERGYIEAQLDDYKTVVCTHLSSSFPIYFEFDLGFGSYVNQSKAEMTLLGDFYNDKKHVALGDFNVGPVVTGNLDPQRNLVGEYPTNWDVLVSMGYRSVYLEEDGRCSYCVSNPFARTRGDNVIDNVLVRCDDFYVDRPKRVLDASTQPLSDHYGVQTRVCEF